MILRCAKLYRFLARQDITKTLATHKLFQLQIFRSSAFITFHRNYQRPSTANTFEVCIFQHRLATFMMGRGGNRHLLNVSTKRGTNIRGELAVARNLDGPLSKNCDTASKPCWKMSRLSPLRFSIELKNPSVKIMRALFLLKSPWRLTSDLFSCRYLTSTYTIWESPYRQNGQDFSSQRCAQRHQQRREVWKASSFDQTILQGYCQVLERHAEARYVYTFFHYKSSLRHDN